MDSIISWRAAAARIATGAALSGFLAGHAAADLTPLQQSLSTYAAATAQPNVPPASSDTHGDTAMPGTLRNMDESSAASDASPDRARSLSVEAAAAVAFQSRTQFTVSLLSRRSGADDAVSAPGGTYDSRASLELSFIALADGTLDIAHTLSYERVSTGSFAPMGVTLSRGSSTDGRSVRVPFASLSGSVAGLDTFTVQENGFYTLRIETAMTGASSSLITGERFEGTFVVTTPRMTVSAVPEPATGMIMGGGLAWLLRVRRRRTGTS